MGAFKIDNPLIRAMIRIADFMIVSLLWLVCCLPVITIFPSCAALYHTTVRVIRRSGDGVIKDFFSAFAASFKKGAVLSVIFAVFAVLTGFALTYGLNLHREGSTFGTVYFVVGCLFALIFMAAVIHIPPALSRFEGGIMLYIRMGLYFAGDRPLRTLLRLVLLALIILLIDFYPVTLLILPGIYADLLSNGLEKQFCRFMDDNGLTDAAGEKDEIAEEDNGKTEDTLTGLEMEKRFGTEDGHE